MCVKAWALERALELTSSLDEACTPILPSIWAVSYWHGSLYKLNCARSGEMFVGRGNEWGLSQVGSFGSFTASFDSPMRSNIPWETAKRPHRAPLVVCSSTGHAFGDAARAVSVDTPYLRLISDPFIHNPHQIDSGCPCWVRFNRRGNYHESCHARPLSNMPLRRQ